MKSVSSKQSGQAIIEYILVLLVVVSILMGVMWQFNDAFRKFSNSYFGNYLACLLEVGELPALGGSSSGQCSAEYEPFDPRNGESPTGRYGDSDGGGGGENPRGSDDGSGGSSSSGSGGSSGAAESSGRFGSNYSGASREGRPASVVIGTAKEDVYTGSTEASNGKARGGSGPRSTRVELVDQSGGVIDPFEQRKIKGAPVAIGKTAEATSAKAKKQKVEINRKVASSDSEEDDTEMGFGGFMRWLLIAAIIIAIVFFLGGQALQIGKNWE